MGGVGFGLTTVQLRAIRLSEMRQLQLVLPIYLKSLSFNQARITTRMNYRVAIFSAFYYDVNM